MAVTLVNLGGIDLDPARFELELARGWQVGYTTIRQLANRHEELRGLPYRCDLTVSCTSEVGRVDGASETVSVRGLRLVEVRQVDEQVSEVVLASPLKDLENRVCPADANLRWKDGWLANTRFPYLPGLIRYLSPLLSELQDVLAPDAFAELPEDTEFELPEGEGLAGMPLLSAGRRVSELLALDPVWGVDGLLRFVRRGSTLDLLIDAYNWLNGARPSWALLSRDPRGLPRTLRFHYWERHALRFSNRDPRDSTASTHPPVELQQTLTQIYAFDNPYGDGRFGTLDELLRAHGFAQDAITDERIGYLIMSENFEGSPLEAGLTQDARKVINIIKRDWRLLWRLGYPDQLGRMGGWVDYRFGYFASVTDKDGVTTYSGDISAAAVRMEYTEYLAQVDEGKETQTTIDDNVVIRSYRRDENGVLPIAPFTAAWESGAEGEVIRLTPKPEPGRQQAVYPGRISNNADCLLTVTKRRQMVLDDGGPFDMPFEVTYIPLPSDMRFAETDHEVNIYAVATRRMPNDASRWWSVDQPGFDAPDVELLEAEVGHELYLLRDYVDPAEGKPAHGDGLGRPLNEDAVKLDAARRARLLRERLGVMVGGTGTAIGVAPLVDLNHPQQAIEKLSLQVDGAAVTTRIDVGELDNAEAREQRRRVRELLKKAQHAGKAVV